MNRLILLLSLSLLLTPMHHSQVIETNAGDDALALRKLRLLSDVQSLEVEARSLVKPLANALAKAEIADAAWTLDQAWAKKLLREAYELTFPDEEERIKLRANPVGTRPTPLIGIERAQNEVRGRVLQVASQDKAFTDQLVQLGAQQLGKYEEHFSNASRASKAFEAGDKEAAGKYIQQSIEADPTQITAGFVILDIATRDRALADKLILAYIERLRTVPLSRANGSLMRVRSILYDFIHPPAYLDPKTPPPGAAVMKAYAYYVIEDLNNVRRSEPDGLQRHRLFLLTAWLPLQQYAPELTGAFLELENLSRRPGEDASLPTRKEADEARKKDYEKRLKDAYDNDQPDELMIRSAIGKGDFDNARKLIGKLESKTQKAELTEMVNVQEAITLAQKGKIVESSILAQRLTKAHSILQVYPTIVGKCVKSKDETCATTLIYEAVNQLKRADTTPPMPPAGIPASAIPTNSELDPVLLSLDKLAKAIEPLNVELALSVLDEVVAAANRSNLDTGRGRVGFDSNLFHLLAVKDESRTHQAAANLQKPLQKIVAVAAIYKWKAHELTKQMEAEKRKKQGKTETKVAVN